MKPVIIASKEPDSQIALDAEAFLQEHFPGVDVTRMHYRYWARVDHPTVVLAHRYMPPLDFITEAQGLAGKITPTFVLREGLSDTQRDLKEDEVLHGLKGVVYRYEHETGFKAFDVDNPTRPAEQILERYIR